VVLHIRREVQAALSKLTAYSLERPAYAAARPGFASAALESLLWVRRGVGKTSLLVLGSINESIVRFRTVVFTYGTCAMVKSFPVSWKKGENNGHNGW
jgi:hypothetical protein